MENIYFMWIVYPLHIWKLSGANFPLFEVNLMTIDDGFFLLFFFFVESNMGSQSEFKSP